MRAASASASVRACAASANSAAMRSVRAWNAFLAIGPAFHTKRQMMMIEASEP